MEVRKAQIMGGLLEEAGGSFRFRLKDENWSFTDVKSLFGTTVYDDFLFLFLVCDDCQQEYRGECVLHPFIIFDDTYVRIKENLRSNFLLGNWLEKFQLSNTLIWLQWKLAKWKASLSYCFSAFLGAIISPSLQLSCRIKGGGLFESMFYMVLQR